MPPLTPKERALAEQLDECNESLRQVRDQAKVVPARSYQGFSKSESGIISLLSVGGLHSAKSVCAHLNALDDYRERGSVNSTQVTLCKVRAKLRRLAPSATIETNGLNGYSMTAASIAVMDRLLVA